MTQTTNIGLKKIDGSENWRQIFDYHNDSADKTDSAVAAVQDGLAIVANGNTHAAIAEGQFVYVRNHSTLAEGLYKASSAIQTNGGLTTSNLTADGSGGLNNLQEQVTSLNSKLSKIGTIVNGTLYNPNVPKDGTNTTLGVLFVNKGTWIITATGWSPIGATQVQATACQLKVHDSSSSIADETLTQKFELTGIVVVDSDNTRIDFLVTNWESSATSKAGTNYTLKAMQIA